MRGVTGPAAPIAQIESATMKRARVSAVTSHPWQGVNRELAGASADFVDRHAELVHQADKKIGHRGAVGILQMPAAPQLAATSTEEQQRQVSPRVARAVGNTRAV